MKTPEWVGHNEAQGYRDCEDVAIAPIGAREIRSGAHMSSCHFVANPRP